MRENEEIKEILGEVQKYVEVKKAFVLRKILQDAPVVSEVDKKRITKQIEQIRENINLSPDEFEKAIESIERGRNNTIRKSSDYIKRKNKRPASTQKRKTQKSEEYFYRYCLNSKCKKSFKVSGHVRRAVNCVYCSHRTVAVVQGEKKTNS